MDKKTTHNVEKFYYDNYRVNKDGTERGLNIYENNFGNLDGGRHHDPIYNDENVGRQIYTFGCSWTYGWGVEQTKPLLTYSEMKTHRFIIMEQVEQV